MSEGAKGVTPADLHKAQRLSLGAGLAAGLFGSVVGVGGGVVIVPMIANACRWALSALWVMLLRQFQVSHI